MAVCANPRASDATLHFALQFSRSRDSLSSSIVPVPSVILSVVTHFVSEGWNSANAVPYSDRCSDGRACVGARLRLGYAAICSETATRPLHHQPSSRLQGPPSEALWSQFHMNATQAIAEPLSGALQALQPALTLPGGLAALAALLLPLLWFFGQNKDDWEALPGPPASSLVLGHLKQASSSRGL